MATLIAVLVVAFLFWQQMKKGVGRRDLPSPAERVADERPFPDTPQMIEPSPADSRAPATAPVLETMPRTAYAFASRRPAGRIDRTAGIARMARGKGLCSPRQTPS